LKKSDTHVVVVCTACGHGGSVANVALKQARELAKYFSKVTLISESFPDKVPNGVRICNITPQRFYWLRRFCHVPNEYAFDNAVLRALTDLHKNEKVDLILFHGHSPATIAGIPLKQKYGIPYALVTHGDIFDRPAGTYDRLLTAFYKKMTPPAYQHADLIIALSPHMAECAKRGGAKPENVALLANGIDLEDIGLDFDTATTRSGHKNNLSPLGILYVGVLSVPKGVETLLGACAVLKAWETPFSLTIAGTGPLESFLKRQADDHGLKESVHFKGYVPRHDLGHLYQQADVVCVPSLSDPLPTVVLESLAAGTPVVGTEVGGIPFMIDSGFNGLLIPPGNPQSLAEVLRRLAENRDTLDCLAVHARPSVLPRFSWELVGQRLRELITLTTDACGQHRLYASRTRSR
jgi:glycosyltransferase involved in cell wall biosynthesis